MPRPSGRAISLKVDAQKRSDHHSDRARASRRRPSANSALKKPLVPTKWAKRWLRPIASAFSYC
jgi:hypothetical protein